MTHRHNAYQASNEVVSNLAQNQHLAVNQLHHSMTVRPATFSMRFHRYQMDVIQMPKELKTMNKKFFWS